MNRYIKYALEDGSEILIQVSEPEEGLVKASRASDKIEDAQKTFEEALDNVRLSALQIRKKFHDLQADEVEVTFGLTATGDFGNNIFAICKVGVEANYEVTLKWKKQEPEDLDKRIQEQQDLKELRKALQ